jgi:hypothetical protein
MKNLLVITSFMISGISFAQPANDDPCNATALAISAACVNITGSNVGATASAGVPAPGCASYSGGDVWYSITVPANGDIIATTDNAGGFTDGGMATYSGTCGSLTLLSCNDDGGPGLFSMINETGLTPGSTIWIRVWEYGNNSFGDFSICVTSAAPVGTPANDDPCNATALSIGVACVNTTGSNTGATASTGVPAPGCASYSGGDVWYSITVPANGDITATTDNAGGFTDGGMATYSGACGTLTLLSCNDDGGPGLFSMINETGLTPGSTIWIRVWEYGNNSFGDFSICVTSPAPIAPANDDPCNAIGIGVGTSCVNTTGTNLNATASAGVPAPGCANYTGGDIWYSVTVPSSGEITVTTSSAGGFTDGGVATYSGTCASLNLLSCNDDGGPGLFSEIVSTGLTPGATIWIRVWEYGNNNFGDFNICVVDPNPVAGGFNDDPCTATSLTIGSACTNVTGTNVGATASAGVPAPGCASYSGGDVWYTATVPASGNVTFSTSTAGGFTDGGMATYSGTCGSLTLLNCNDDGGTGLFSEIVSTGLAPGTTIFIRVWEYGNNSFGDFNICGYEPVPPNVCGDSGPTINTNDFCSTPATLTSGGTSFSSTTASTFSQDLPGNVNSVFCGSIENNSWYQFTASAANESFNITSVANCASGIQAEVYEITYDGNGCCTAFTSVSNCYNPGSTALGPVNATGLTVGQDYMLMIDGFGGSNCDFTISGWSGVNILPVQMLGLTGYARDTENLLSWTTASEVNNHSFIIGKSTDGKNYIKIGEEEGSGNSSSKIDYEFIDKKINHPIIYYRLTQVDFDGSSKTIGNIFITRELDNIIAYPNPASDKLTFTFNTSLKGIYNLEFVDVQGRVVSESLILENTNSANSIIFNELKEGLYLVRILHNNLIIETIKIIKE